MDAISETQSRMYSLALDPKVECSDHESDFELCPEREYDTDPEPSPKAPAPESIQSEPCTCEKCPQIEEGYCCGNVGVVNNILENEDKTLSALLSQTSLPNAS